jgi:hypothetical protein
MNIKQNVTAFDTRYREKPLGKPANRDILLSSQINISEFTTTMF